MPCPHRSAHLWVDLQLWWMVGSLHHTASHLSVGTPLFLGLNVLSMHCENMLNLGAVQTENAGGWISPGAASTNYDQEVVYKYPSSPFLGGKVLGSVQPSFSESSQEDWPSVAHSSNLIITHPISPFLVSLSLLPYLCFWINGIHLSLCLKVCFFTLARI